MRARQAGLAGGAPPLDAAEFAPRTGRFASRYGPLFQQCVVDVAAKLARGGAADADAFRGAFRICRRSVGERRFDAHAVRRSGVAIEDPAQTAAAYEALLVRYQVRPRALARRCCRGVLLRHAALRVRYQVMLPHASCVLLPDAAADRMLPDAAAPRCSSAA